MRAAQIGVSMFVASLCYHRRKNCLQSTKHYLLDDKHHLVYCFVPKNACSFWKRVFSILDGKHKGSAVFNLSSVAIHTSRAFDRLGGDRSFIELYHFLQSSKKIMFVRDPYERLFSGYIDKLFSPCSMTREEVKVIRLFRENETNTACQPGVSFTEFLQYVTNQRSVGVNPHFGRQYPACLPCHVDYDYIGKLETFQQDAEYILKEAAHIDPREVFGASEQFEENSDLNIINDVAKRSFKRCNFNKTCVSRYNVLLRLWVTFQVGYYGRMHVRKRVCMSLSVAKFKEDLFRKLLSIIHLVVCWIVWFTSFSFAFALRQSEDLTFCMSFCTGDKHRETHSCHAHMRTHMHNHSC